ncbi:Cys-tRNA(Pro) deacylase [Colwellia sp. Arc7-635]|uniref:Cys-tRNA(Pro) deacylase n=1 Tax=Colwellia sp. Arc7-635 TaxID=2497879 RepID=UPI000F84F40C|nr:Cys-tRNA(Pro) deacylase [Colwellia sp. Arc7-635]AZQ83943.1 Cys-tRNA(Pro) deacylase [Colwellia sp. Arc7-635]
MTPAVDQLDKLALPYTLHQYQHETHCKSFGLEAIDKLKVSADLVFKTLVVDVDSSYLAVAIIPALEKLNLKKLAKVLNAKKVKMAEINKVQNSTGYVLGGVSPLGQKKRLVTLIDKSAEALSTLFISGGKRGLEIELSPCNLALSLEATYANIINE